MVLPPRGIGYLLVVLAWPAMVRADVGVVVVVGRDAPETAAAVERSVGVALTGAGETAVTGVLATARAAAADGAVPATALAGFVRVAELVEEGWRAYLQVSTEFAVSRLGEARRQAEALLPLDGGLEVYADAALRLGAALDNDGRHDEADDALRLAAALDPGRTVTLAEFSPDVVAAATRAAAVVRASRRARITVDAIGATVEIDGGAPVAAPAELELAEGQHVVVARAPGRSARGQTFSVTAEGAAVAVALDRDRASAGLADGAAVGQGEDEALGWVEGAIAYGEVDAVVIAAPSWRSGRPALLLQWCDGAPVTCTAAVEVGYDAGGLAAASRAAVEDLLAARTGRRYGVTLPGDPRLGTGKGPGGGGDGCRWCRPALYAGVGVAAIAVVVTAIVVASGGDEGAEVSIDPDDFLGE